MTTTKLEPEMTNRTEGDLSLPYPPSWVDRIIARIDRLSWPAWLVYSAALLAGLLIRHAAHWIDGSLPAGSFSLDVAVGAPFLVVPPVAQYYLNATARRALREFRPALQIEDARSTALEYQLTTLPARAGLIAGGLGAALQVLAIAINPASFGISSINSPITNVLESAYLMLVAALLLVFIFHTLRQLRLVASLHARAKQLNLFQLVPVYAFSSLTARTGLVILLYVYYNFGFYFYLNIQRSPTGFLETAGLVFLFVVSVSCFVLPLHGIHHRLVAEKSPCWERPVAAPSTFSSSCTSEWTMANMTG